MTASSANAVNTRSPRVWSRRVRVAAAALAVVLGLLLTEGLLRAWLIARGMTPTCYAAAVLMFQPHPLNGAELTPGFRLRSQVLEVSINRQGLRGREIELSPPPGTRRVVVLGGSAAFGYFVSDDATAAARLERRLQARGLAVEVLNAAVPSYDLKRNLVRYRERVAPLRPEVVILYLGWNDLKQVTAEVEPLLPTGPTLLQRCERLLAHSSLYGVLRYRLFPPRPHFIPHTPGPITMTAAGRARFEQRLEELATLIAATPAQMVVCTQAMAAHPDAPAEIRRELSDAPERQAEMIAWGRYLSATLRRFAARHNAVFVDADSQIPPTYEYLGDAIHLTPLGEDKLAELLEPAVVQALDVSGAARLEGPGTSPGKGS